MGFKYNFHLKTLIYNGSEISILRNFLQQICPFISAWFLLTFGEVALFSPFHLSATALEDDTLCVPAIIITKHMVIKLITFKPRTGDVVVSEK